MTTARSMAATKTGGAGTLGAVRTIAADIKLAHSIFALPFAILAAFMAAASPAGAIPWSRFAGQLALVVLAMVFARSVAMLANRLLDREIDRRNPRTAGRALPSGRVRTSGAVVAILVCSVCFVVICGGFAVLYENLWPLALSVPVLLWISSYALLKRFTALCHLYLGSSLAISPLAAAIAIDPVALTDQPSIWLLSAMVLCWVAGFDIIYALQDLEVDRREGLYSMPGRLGARRALLVSRGLHVAAAVALAAAAWIDPRFGVLFAAAVALVVTLLVYEHATVARWGTSRLALAFFTLNGLISCLLGAIGVADVIL